MSHYALLDENNIVTNGPIVGQEYLYLKISTPTLEEFDIDFETLPASAVPSITSKCTCTCQINTSSGTCTTATAFRQ